MPNPRLASRYAKALLGIAIEQNQMEQVYTDMHWLQAAIRQSRDLLNLLRSPIIKADLKTKALQAVLQNNVTPLTQRFTALLASKNRESILPEIAPAFIEQYKEAKKHSHCHFNHCCTSERNGKEQHYCKNKTRVGL